MIKWIVGVALAGALMNYAYYQLGAGARVATELNAKHNSDVVLYSAAWCTACAATRRFLNANQIEFVELDMEQDPQGSAEFAQFGGHGIPLVIAKGTVIRGHRPQALIQALQ